MINLFNQWGCEIKVTDIKPIFDLNKQVKRLRKINPNPTMTLGEHKDEDFIEADIIVYSSSVDPSLPQLRVAKSMADRFILTSPLLMKTAQSLLLLFVEVMEEPLSLT